MTKDASAVLDYYVQQAIIKGAAGSSYKIRTDYGLKEPKFDGKTIFLPVLGVNCTKEDIDQQRAFVNRCVAYGRWGEGNRTPILKHFNPNEKLTQMFHQSDDTRCERLESKDYIGVYDNLVRAEDSSLKSLFKQLSTLDDSVFNDEKASRELAQLATHTLGMATWNPSSRDCLDLMIKLYRGSKTGEFIEKIFEAGVHEDFLEATKSDDAYKIAKKAYDIIWKDPLGEGQGTGDHDGKGGSGESSGSSAESMQYGRGVSEDDKRVLKRCFAEYRNFEYQANGTPNPVVITYENRDQNATLHPTEPLSQMPVVDFRTGSWSGGRNRGGLAALGGTLDIDQASAAFANRVRNLLQIKAQAYYTHGHRKGKLSSKRLYRIGMPEVGSGEWNKRVFKKRHQEKILDVAVSIMIDVSGSMHCIKTVWTYKGCVLLNDVFSRILHVPVEIACFNTNDKTRIGIIKHYTANIATQRITEIFDDITGNMTSNNDAAALLFAASRLAQRTEPRKILIMLSDGQPACGSVRDADYQLRAAAKSVEARQDMELYAIGIEYHGVKHFYKNWSEVRTGTDIEEAIIKVLSQALLEA